MPGRYEGLLPVLSLDEQAALTGGTDDWHTTALLERGIPALKVTDGPSGARGQSYTTSTAACFPCGTALGATFDPALVGRVGAAIGAEVRTKAAHVLLGPTLNLVRHPLGGRNFESYGEDPALVAAIGVAFVRGLQSTGVGACPKHLVANDAEIERLSISSDVDERTLREVYLRPFEAAVVDADAWALMGAYNKLNGIHCCEHRDLLTGIVRDEWGFDGLLISDWFATLDTVRCIEAGVDLEMPGPPAHFGPHLAAAVRRGEVDATEVARAARHVLRLLDRVGATTEPEAERAEDDPSRWALAREASAAATVLLRNRDRDGAPVLPIDPGTLRSLAVVGPNADVAIVQGGGSARVLPHRTVSPLAGIRAVFAGVDVRFAPGTHRGDTLEVLDGRLASAEGVPGIAVEYSADGHRVLDRGHIERLDPIWSGTFSPAVDPLHFHARLRTTLQPRVAGPHVLGVTSIGPCRVLLDGEVLIDNPATTRGQAFFGYGSPERRVQVDLEPGRPRELVVEYARPPGEAMGAVRVGVAEPRGDDALDEAVALAARCDAAIVVVGNDEEIEAESRDRVRFGLGGRQDELVRRVAAANPRTVVVVNAGGPVDLPWLDDPGAVLCCWFGGMAMGEALADVLTGAAEPTGRMPFTIPVALEDAPCDIRRPDPPGHLRYEERLLIGHRSYLARDVAPRVWFGEGSGYARTHWSAAAAPVRWQPGTPLAVSLTVTNEGERATTDVVQVYARRPASTLERPPWVLCGFARVHVSAGEAAGVQVPIDPAALRHWDEQRGWQVERGPLELRIARHAGDPGTTVQVEID